MKNKLFLPLLLTLLFLSAFVLKTSAQTATATPTTTDLQEKAQKLLDIVASDAARLNLTEKRGIIGTVTDVSGTQIKVEDAQGNTRFIDVDELTKFSSPDAKGTFGISDIKEDMTIGVLGLYNKSSRRILARFVDVMTLPKYVHGVVVSIDNENFTFSVSTDEEKTLLIDVATITRTNSFTPEDGLIKSGFSRVETDQNVTIVGYPDKNVADKILASFIIHFPNLPKNPAIKTLDTSSSGAINSSSETATASTGSGVILIPQAR